MADKKRMADVIQLDMFEDNKALFSAAKNYEQQVDYINTYLAAAYGIDDITAVPKDKFIELVKVMVLSLQDECSELLNELPWKPWKAGHNDPDKIDMVEARFEVIDLAMFVNNLVMIMFDDHAQFNAYFAAKLKENVRRQVEGYSYGLAEATNTDVEELRSAGGFTRKAEGNAKPKPGLCATCDGRGGWHKHGNTAGTKIFCRDCGGTGGGGAS